MIISQLLIFFALSLKLGGPYCAAHVKGAFTTIELNRPHRQLVHSSWTAAETQAGTLQFRRVMRVIEIRREFGDETPRRQPTGV
jgi:hypothetical protein